jgi:hypothetical protein
MSNMQNTKRTRRVSITFLKVNDKGEVVGLEDEHTSSQIVCKHCGEFTWTTGNFCQWCGKLPRKVEYVKES